MEVDWGGKLIVNFMVNWGVHETYPNGHNISTVDWGDHDSSCSNMNEFSLSEVDWGAHDSSYFLYLVFIDPDAKPKDFFTQSPCLSLTITVLLVGHSYYLLKRMGRDSTSTSLMAYLKYSFDIEDRFSNSKSIKQYGSSYSLPDLEQHESSYNLPTQWDAGEKPLQPPLFMRAIPTKIMFLLWIQSDYNLSCMLSKHWKLIKIFPKIKKLVITYDLSQSQQLRKEQENMTEETPHVIQIKWKYV